MGRFKLWMILGGIAFAWFGIKEWRLAGVVKAQPQTLTCAALAKDGYGENAHVKLTDFLIVGQSTIYQERRRNKKWKKVWIPLVPGDGAYAQALAQLPEDADVPVPKTFHVILQSDKVTGESSLGALVRNRKTLTGVIINEVDSLDSDTRKLLADSYPNVDLETCWILEQGREPKSAAASLGFAVFGLALIGAGIFFFVRGARGPRREETAEADADQAPS